MSSHVEIDLEQQGCGQPCGTAWEQSRISLIDSMSTLRDAPTTTETLANIFPRASAASSFNGFGDSVKNLGSLEATRCYQIFAR